MHLQATGRQQRRGHCHGIRKDEWQGREDAFLQELRDGKIGIVEERVIQHPRNGGTCAPPRSTPSASPRCWAIKSEGIVYAFLRIGNGKVMDNVDQGGMAARVDLESGKLLTVGCGQGRATPMTEHPMTAYAHRGL